MMMSASVLQPPVQPAYIFRGHTAQIHALHFWQRNSYLLSGDADGWVVAWDLVTRRARAVWKAHNSSILTLGHWGKERIITHGRDSSLKVWHVPMSAQLDLSTVLPAEGDDDEFRRKNPWLLHSLDVNSMNFCSFSSCRPSSSTASSQADQLLLAVPGTKEGHVDIFELPSERRLHTVPPPKDAKTGMVMTSRLLYRSGSLKVVIGFESGLTCIQSHRPETDTFSTIYSCHAHKQPILSLDVSVSLERYYTSGADAVISSHPLAPKADVESDEGGEEEAEKKAVEAQMVQTGHSGQQSLALRSDSRIFATAGWDSRVRVYSAKSLNEMAVLKWHSEGCYAVAFAEIFDNGSVSGDESSPGASQLDIQKLEGEKDATDGSEQSLAVAGERLGGTQITTVRQRREQKTRETHWLAAGSKDGKISLWMIY